MDTELLALAFQIVLWGAFFGATIGGISGAVGGAMVAVLFIATVVVGKPSSRYGLYE